MRGFAGVLVLGIDSEITCRRRCQTYGSCADKLGFHINQATAHIGMTDNFGLARNRAALHPLIGVIQRRLVGALAYGNALNTHK